VDGELIMNRQAKAAAGGLMGLALGVGALMVGYGGHQRNLIFCALGAAIIGSSQWIAGYLMGRP
jgi:hypothetical protein